MINTKPSVFQQGWSSWSIWSISWRILSKSIVSPPNYLNYCIKKPQILVNPNSAMKNAWLIASAHVLFITPTLAMNSSAELFQRSKISSSSWKINKHTFWTFFCYWHKKHGQSHQQPYRIHLKASLDRPLRRFPIQVEVYWAFRRSPSSHLAILHRTTH